MRTAIVSDLHLGSAAAPTCCAASAFATGCSRALDGADRLVLLGDVLELRDRPLRRGARGGRAGARALGEAFAGRELVIVPGNHDHHLIEPWLERAALDGARRARPRAARRARRASRSRRSPRRRGAAEVRFAYPGIWIRDDVYATHGHYLDRHLTVPTIERLGVAMVERVLGIPAAGPDPLAPPDDDAGDRLDEYERVQTPVYALLFGLAQATVGERRGGAEPSVRIWQMLGGGETPRREGAQLAARLGRGPGAVGVANRLGLGPVRADLSAGAIARAGLRRDERGRRAARDRRRARDLRPHPPPRRARRAPGAGRRSGTPAAGSTPPRCSASAAAVSPYWPGTICFVDDDGEPELVTSSTTSSAAISPRRRAM